MKHTTDNHIMITPFPCYKREFIKGEKAGKWKRTDSVIEYGEGATTSMLADGSGYYINDPENEIQYFMDMSNR